MNNKTVEESVIAKLQKRIEETRVSTTISDSYVMWVNRQSRHSNWEF